MTDPRLAAIFDFLSKLRPHYGAPRLVVLGGSQTLDGGIHKTSTSDHDVLVFFDDITQPESFSFAADDGRKYDLMLRDPKTFAYDLGYVSDAGRGTLLHIALNGVALHDPLQIHENLKDSIRPLYLRGPNLPHEQDFKAEIMALRRNFYTLRDMCLSNAFLPALVALTNRIAKDFLLYSGHWTSTGKIAGRFLHEKLPDVKGLLARSFNHASRAGDITLYETAIMEKLHAAYFTQQHAGRTMAAPSPEHPFDAAETDFGAATTACRLNLDAFAAYLQGQNPTGNLAAATWGHSKIETVRRAIDAERFHRPSGEYFYALGRGVSSLSEIYAATIMAKPSDVSMTQRIAMLSSAFPQLKSATVAALKGNPQSFQTVFDSVLNGIQGEPAPYSFRPSRADMVADDAALRAILIPA